MKRRTSRLFEYLGAAGIVVLVTLISLALRNSLKVIDVAMLYLLAVVLVASRYARRPAIFASVLSIVLFDVGFVPPYGRLDVHDSAYVLTFAMMLFVAVVMSRLTARIRDQAGAAVLRERRTAALYELGRDLGNTSTSGEIAAVVSRHASAAVFGTAALALHAAPAASDTPENGTGQGPGEPRMDLGFQASPLFAGERARQAAEWAYTHDLPAGAGTGEFGDLDVLFLPVRSVLHQHGVLAVRGTDLGIRGAAELRTLELLARQAGSALERLELADEHARARLAVEAERLRTTLLSSLSHDLRTPLAGIEGAATTLLSTDTGLNPDIRRDLAETIVEESRRMSRLVANLLDMVRLETEVLTLRKSWVPLEEVIGVARVRLDERLARHPVTVRLPADLPLVPVDEILMEQVLVNLLENAARHTPVDTPITISAWNEGSHVVVEVADCGPGIPTALAEAVFGKFYRAVPPSDHTVGSGLGGSSGESAATGAGLGLSICRGVLTAHGGRIWVEPRRGGGAAFRFTIPLDGPPPVVSPEHEESPEVPIQRTPVR